MMRRAPKQQLQQALAVRRRRRKGRAAAKMMMMMRMRRMRKISKGGSGCLPRWGAMRSRRSLWMKLTWRSGGWEPWQPTLRSR